MYLNKVKYADIYYKLIYILKMYKAILENLDKLWKWIKNISTLDYGALLKNFIVAVLIIVVCFLSLNINLIVSSPLFVLEIIGMVILVFFIVQLIGDIHRKITDKKEMKSVSKRILFQEEIQSRLKDTMYKLNADRIFIEELHNSVANFGGLGFIKFTMSYEVVNQTKPIPVPYISSGYQSQQATLYNLPIYLKRNGFYKGNIEEVSNVDNRYGFNMSNEGDKYGAFMTIPGMKTKPMIGWVAVIWRDEKDKPDDDAIQTELADLARSIAPLFNMIN